MSTMADLDDVFSEVEGIRKAVERMASDLPVHVEVESGEGHLIEALAKLESLAKAVEGLRGLVPAVEVLAQTVAELREDVQILTDAVAEPVEDAEEPAAIASGRYRPEPGA